MTRTTKWQTIISLLVTLSLLWQMYPPSPLAATTAVETVPVTPTNSPTAVETPDANHSLTDHPFSIYRVQSGYNVGSQITISYTVSNNLPVTSLPDLGPNATLTDTINLVANHPITNDMNSLTNLSLSTTLTGADFVDASGQPQQNGDTLVWQLPPLAPASSTVITLTVNPPSSAADFVNLDNGANLQANLWGQQLTAQARPAVVVPDSLDASLTAVTPDAIATDPDLLWMSAQTNQDPLQFFDYVKTLAFEPYLGSLRGTRGTLWGEAGNAVDQSSLLIAALRAAGVPARYRHGSLTTSQAQTLLATLFDPPTAVAGYLPDDVPLADPLNDPDLLALTQDHWWVEAYLPGQGWTDLDPTFPGTAVGQSIATPTNNDRIAELPADLRHTVSFNLEVEQYNSFPVNGTFLDRFNPLQTSYATAELASRPLIFGNFVQSSAAGGIYTNVEHSYTPYFTVEGTDEYFLGEPFQDLLTNFPFATHFTTGMWLTVQTTSPDGQSETFTREIQDLIGQHARMGGTIANISPANDNAALVGEADLYVTWFLPNLLNNSQLIERYRDQIYHAGQQFARDVAPAIDLFDVESPTPDQQDLLNQAMISFRQSQAKNQAASGLDFALMADQTTRRLEDGLLVELFYQQPRIIIVETAYDPNSDTVRKSIDLRTTRATAVVHPGQAQSAALTANWLKGVAESYHEGLALQRFTGIAPLTSARVFDAMTQQGIQPILITPSNADLLQLYPLDPAAFAYAALALQEGKHILIPSQPVSLDGESVLSWWEIDPETGETISVGENGLHVSLIEWNAISIGFGAPFTFDSVYGLRNSVKEIWDYVVCHVVPALGGVSPITGDGCTLENPFGLPWPFSCSFCRMPEATLTETSWMDLPAHLCPIDECGIERFVLGAERQGPMPLPDILFRYPDPFLAQTHINGLLPVSTNGQNGQPSLGISTDPPATTAVARNLTQFTILLDANFSDDINVNVYAPDGWFVSLDETGQVAYSFPADSPNGDYTLTIVGQAQNDPTLVTTAVHTVTLGQNNGLGLQLLSETGLTVPMNTAVSPAPSGQTNDGEAEIMQSAYQLWLENQTAVTQTVTVEVSGPPANWILLNGQRQANSQIVLAPRQQTAVGLAIQPHDGTLPAPGTSYPITVNASSGSLSASQTDSWSMVPQPFNYLSITQPTLYASPGENAIIPLAMRNVGNQAGNFELAVTLPISAGTLLTPPNPFDLAVGQTAVQTITLNSQPLDLGSRVPLLFASTAYQEDGDPLYTQYLFSQLQIVSPHSQALFEAADSCTVTDNVGTALQALAQTVVELENWCSQGDCPLPLRDQAVEAGQLLINYAQTAVQPLTLPALTDVQTAVDHLSQQSQNDDILQAIASLSTAVTGLSHNLCEVEQHQLSANFTPYVQAILLGSSATYNLNISNQGTLTTSYAISVTGLPTGDLFFDQLIAPNQTLALPISSTPSDLGVFNIEATVAATIPDGQVAVQDTAVARLNVVDKFVQLLAVTADPPFVETGVSSTTLSIELANLAGISLAATAATAVTSPDGNTLFSQQIPLSLLAGPPHLYQLATVDTSNWAAGVYTVTVDLLDANQQLLPDGAGHGYFSVGQAVQLSQSVWPEVVAPGTVTVTTFITSEIATAPTAVAEIPFHPLYNGPLTAADEAYLQRPSTVAPNLEGQPELPLLVAGDPQSPSPLDTAVDLPMPLLPEETAVVAELPTAVEEIAPTSLDLGPAFTRLEQDEPAWAYVGSWSNHTTNRASGGTYWRSNTAGHSAEIQFYGTWVSLGFVGDRFGGYADIRIDGTLYDTFDLHRNEEMPISYKFDNLSPMTHTVTIDVLGTSSPHSFNSRVQLDYVDFGDGTAVGDGTFEESDGRVIKSNGWSTNNYAGASGGSYISSSSGSAWFPFDGDSFSLQLLSYNQTDFAILSVDGVYLDTIDIRHTANSSNAITRTYSYDGLGAGPHLLQISSYRSQLTIDTLTTPGTGPFIDPNPPVTGITRYEEDHQAILYNGLPSLYTSFAWERVSNIFANYASQGQYIYANAVGDTVSFDFEGSWLGVGFMADRFGGQVDIHIDGQWRETLDTYRRFDDTFSVYYDDLGPGAHNITITILETAHPNSLNRRIYIDYFDVWDGQPLPDGTFEEDHGRIYYDATWGDYSDENASGGTYRYSSVGTLWIPFTGDSITIQGLTALTYDESYVRVDGQPQQNISLTHAEHITRSFSFAGFGEGAHVLELRRYRGGVTLDNFTTPALTPPVQPPQIGPIFRYEEDHPDMLYQGYPFPLMYHHWNFQDTWYSSGWGNTTVSTAGNEWQLTFEGVWINVGFAKTSAANAVEIFIDDVSQGVFDTSGGLNDAVSFSFANLSPGTHTMRAVLISGAMRPDYVDVWNGQPIIEEGWQDVDVNDPNGRFHFGNRQWWVYTENEYAINGSFWRSFPSIVNNVWFNFVGNDLSILGFNANNTTLTVHIDGVSHGSFDMTAEFTNQPYALHFQDLGEGAHTVLVAVSSHGRIDAFQGAPDNFYTYTPVIEWYDITAQEVISPYEDTGFLSSVAIGDLSGDGIIELVAPSHNGRVYVYRGDGQDSGNGTPIIWQTDLVGPAAEPALADINNDGLAEIILSGKNGTFAFRHDGSLLWHNPDVVSYYPSEAFGWGGPTIGNLDFDPEPEIAIAASNDAFYILDHEGNITFTSDPIGVWPTVPVLADITGDGILDAIVGQGLSLSVYDIANGGQIVWTYTLPDPIFNRSALFGSPGIADINGDGLPEIIVNWGSFVEALNPDGTVLWRYDANDNDLYRPSGITIADVTGDGQVEIITASAVNAGFLVFDHLLMVIDVDGNLVWNQLVRDSTASASGVAAQDLTGDGIWEIIWNGFTDGFLIMRGSDGKRLFNEMVTFSGTVLDYPSLGDVDGDGYAEAIVSGREGLYVIGHDGVWADSRPLWNQHNYHINNINDDFSIPESEQNSWELHNTYRTQTPERTPSLSYHMAFTYTEGSPYVTVLTQTAAISLTAVPPLYSWQYHQPADEPLRVNSFDSLLTDLQPGETRQLSAGLEVAYRLPSGFNYLTLPPLYVTVPALGELTPASQTVSVGSTAVYTLSLHNASQHTAVYTLAASGMPTDWLSYPSSVTVPAGQSTAVAITVATPANALAQTLPLWLDVDWNIGGSNGRSYFSADLTLVNGVSLSLDPASQSGATGTPLSYQLTVSNLENSEQTYQLSASGSANATLPSSVTVAANSSQLVTVTAVPSNPGPHPFTILASASNGSSGQVDGVAIGEGSMGVLAQINPSTALTGPGATAVYTATLTNIGDGGDSYSLALQTPVGWSGQLMQMGTPISEIALPAHLYNSSELQLLVSPAIDALPGSYPLTLTVQSLSQPGITATAVATAEVSDHGVTVIVSPANQSVDPSTPTSWDVTVTNVGSVGDSFDLLLSGSLAQEAQFSQETVTLAAGASQTVQLTAVDLSFLLAGSHQFGVTAQSQAEPSIRAERISQFVIEPATAVAVMWQPQSRIVDEGLVGWLTFVVSNSGNVQTVYAVDVAGAGLNSELPLQQVTIPARGTAVLSVRVTATAPGSYTVTGSATGGGQTAVAEASITFTSQPVDDNLVIYLPFMIRP